MAHIDAEAQLLAMKPPHPVATGIPTAAIHRMWLKKETIQIKISQHNQVNTTHSINLKYFRTPSIITVELDGADFRAMVSQEMIVVVFAGAQQPVIGLAFNETEDGAWLFARTPDGSLEMYTRGAHGNPEPPRLRDTLIRELVSGVGSASHVKGFIKDVFYDGPDFSAQLRGATLIISCNTGNNVRAILKPNDAPTIYIDGILQSLRGVGTNRINGGAWILLRTDTIWLELCCQGFIG